MIISAPKDENELQHLIFTAVNAGHAMAIRYPRGEGYGVPIDKVMNKLEIGKGELLKQGNDIALVAIGSTVYPCMEAASTLEQKGLSAAVINARFAKPLDSELIIELAQRTGKIVTVEENTLTGGFGSAVLELLSSSGIQANVKCIGIPDIYVEHGTPELLRSIYKLDSKGIEKQISAFFPELSSVIEQSYNANKSLH